MQDDKPKECSAEVIIGYIWDSTLTDSQKAFLFLLAAITYLRRSTENNDPIAGRVLTDKEGIMIEDVQALEELGFVVVSRDGQRTPSFGHDSIYRFVLNRIPSPPTS